LHGHRIDVHTEETPLRDFSAQRRALSRRDVPRVPAAFPNQALFGGCRQIPACADEERAASHRGIEHAQLQDLFRRPIADKRFQCATNHGCRDRSRRIERSARLARVARSSERSRTLANRLVLEDAFVHGAELLHIQVGV